jgi:hypothetical protein
VLNAYGFATAPAAGRPSLHSKLGMSPNTTFLSRLLSGVQRTNNRLIAQTRDAAAAYRSDLVAKAPAGPLGEDDDEAQDGGEPEEAEEEEEDEEGEEEGEEEGAGAGPGDPWTPGAAHGRASRFQQALTPATPAPLVATPVALREASAASLSAAAQVVLVGRCTAMAPREALSGQVFEFAYRDFGERWQDVLVSRHIRSAAGHVYAPEEVSPPTPPPPPHPTLSQLYLRRAFGLYASRLGLCKPLSIYLSITRPAGSFCLCFPWLLAGGFGGVCAF